MRKKQEILYSEGQPEPPADALVRKQEITRCIEENIDQLLGIIRSYVLRFGLANYDDVQSIALEVFQEVVVEALAHSNNFAGPKQPIAWLLGIAINIIRRKKAAAAKRYSHETPIELFSLINADRIYEDDLPQHYTLPSTDGPELIVEDAEQVQMLLSLVPQEDRNILRRAILDDLKHEVIARELAITPDAARARLHRALVRLRAAWHKQQEQNNPHSSKGAK